MSAELSGDRRANDDDQQGRRRRRGRRGGRRHRRRDDAPRVAEERSIDDGVEEIADESPTDLPAGELQEGTETVEVVSDGDGLVAGEAEPLDLDDAEEGVVVESRTSDFEEALEPGEADRGGRPDRRSEGARRDRGRETEREPREPQPDRESRSDEAERSMERGREAALPLDRDERVESIELREMDMPQGDQIEVEDWDESEDEEIVVSPPEPEVSEAPAEAEVEARDEAAPRPVVVETLSDPRVGGQKGAQEMLINVADPDECRIALVTDGQLDELYMERKASASHVGNIYKGRVTNVEPSIQAAFIDFGLPINGFLHISDLHPQYFPGDQDSERVGRKTPRRDRPPIQRCLRRGDEVIVQITKEGIGTKGPTMTTYLSLPGRFLVMMPGMAQLGVSRKVEDDEARRKARQMLAQLRPPKDVGFIVRTAGIGRSQRELQADLNYLTRLWRVIERRIKTQRAPCELYQESDLIIRTIRDAYGAEVTRIIVDDESVAQKVAEFLSIANPRGSDKVIHYAGREPLFYRYGIEQEIEKLHSRHVPLPCGGSLVIDSAEALVAIDVNSGKFRMQNNAEESALRVNLEAADEIARQLRLRDLGGVIICDFIDMRLERHRRAVERRLSDALKSHKERAKILRMSRFGIIEMTRQRQRPSFSRSIYQDCPHCHGRGMVKTIESMTLDVMRVIQFAAHQENINLIDVRVSPTVAAHVQNRKRHVLSKLEAETGKSITITAVENYGADQVSYICLDRRGRDIPLNVFANGVAPAAPVRAAPPPLPARQRPDQPVRVEAPRAAAAPSRDSRDSRDRAGPDRRPAPRPSAAPPRPVERSVPPAAPPAPRVPETPAARPAAVAPGRPAFGVPRKPAGASSPMFPPPPPPPERPAPITTPAPAETKPASSEPPVRAASGDPRTPRRSAAVVTPTAAPGASAPPAAPSPTATWTSTVQRPRRFAGSLFNESAETTRSSTREASELPPADAEPASPAADAEETSAGRKRSRGSAKKKKPATKREGTTAKRTRAKKSDA